MTITATFISEYIDLEAEYQLTSYRLLTRDGKSRVGGVGFYCKDELNPIKNKTSDIESIEH